MYKPLYFYMVILNVNYEKSNFNTHFFDDDVMRKHT